MQATYDEAADALSVTLLPDAKRSRTVKVAAGILAHFDRDQHLIELEVLGASGHYPRAVLAQLGTPAEALTLLEAAQESGLNVSTLRKQIANKKLRGTKSGRDWLITRADLLTYLENRAPSGRPARRKKGRRQSKVAIIASQTILTGTESPEEVRQIIARDAAERKRVHREVTAAAARSETAKVRIQITEPAVEPAQRKNKTSA